MAGLKEALKKELADLLASLNEQGLLDCHYVSAQTVKEIDGSFAFLELISTFRADCQATIRTLTIELDQPLLDFPDMKIQIMKIKGSTSCIGARRLALACGDLTKGVFNESKEECLLALNRIKEEFQVLQEKLDLVTQLERRILCTNFD